MKKNYTAILIFFLIGIANAQIINFPDANFKAKLFEPFVTYGPDGMDMAIDANGNGEIEVSEVQFLTNLNISNGNISDLTGISYFTSLKTLNCSNNLLSTLTIDHAISLGQLNASHNTLTLVDIHLDPQVEGFDLSYNLLTSFTVQSARYFDMYNLSHNKLTNLTIDNAHFEYFYVGANELTAIEVIGTTSVYQEANFNTNKFTLLDLTHFDFDYQCWVGFGNNTVDRVLFGSSPGNIIYVSNNTFFDLGNYTMRTSCEPDEVGNLSIQNCPNLNYFILKNGFNHTVVTCNEGGDIFDNPALRLDIEDCPNLSFICVDELEAPNIQASINRLGLQNQVEVNSYCTFTPGGTFYTVQGKAKIDHDNNGCGSAGLGLPNLKLDIANGTMTGSLVTDETGSYSIPVSEGTHTITPQLENPAYFNVAPASISVTFPTQASPQTQDFCITANGVHPDLEISLLPLIAARPGFDATYKLIYKNKGNTTQSGTVSLEFNDAILDFVSANPGTSSQTVNHLSWNFTNLKAFETRGIIVVLNANSPMETPPVNNGDLLNYNASVTSAATDEMPVDNVFAFTQTVVNSLDPNDKTCLEGNTIAPEMAGKYVHYKIRFENKGTAEAQNIVVKDIIDTDKFEISSLVPVDASHHFTTKISKGNTAEFIFENINLPFDDANNDGYVVFKIKTRPDLVVGNSFSNSASIYFDYNFPIATNTATTTISVLGIKDFEFSDYFTLSPNPANEVLNIQSKKQMVISSISIYNVLGQLVLVSTNFGKGGSVDVSSLKTGNYFIKINSDKGTSNAKFIKK